MTTLLYTTQNLVDEVRSLLDELNGESVDTVKDILPSLNRAQDFAFDVYTRVYPEPILMPLENDPTTGLGPGITVNGGQNDYTIPDTIFEDRVLKVEFAIPAGNGVGRSFREVQRISYRDLSNYESASRTNLPYYYCIFGRTIRFVPNPTGTYQPRLWVLRNPEKLVLPQGRVTKVNAGSGYAVLDSVGPDLTPESDQLGSYVNWVNGRTGEIRATLQLATITENRVGFRAVPMRTSVLGRTVVGTVPSDGDPDDYLCLAEGTCVPYFGKPTANFMIQFGTAEITRKLGGDAATQEQVVQKFEQQVERTWVGRERQTRVQKRSQNWGVPTRRWYYE